MTAAAALLVMPLPFQGFIQAGAPAAGEDLLTDCFTSFRRSVGAIIVFVSLVGALLAGF